MSSVNVAASNGFLDIVDLFLKRPCDLNSRDSNGKLGILITIVICV